MHLKVSEQGDRPYRAHKSRTGLVLCAVGLELLGSRIVVLLPRSWQYGRKIRRYDHYCRGPIGMIQPCDCRAVLEQGKWVDNVIGETLRLVTVNALQPDWENAVLQTCLEVSLTTVSLFSCWYAGGQAERTLFKPVPPMLRRTLAALLWTASFIWYCFFVDGIVIADCEPSQACA